MPMQPLFRLRALHRTRRSVPASARRNAASRIAEGIIFHSDGVIWRGLSPDGFIADIVAARAIKRKTLLARA